MHQALQSNIPQTENSQQPIGGLLQNYRSFGALARTQILLRPVFGSQVVHIHGLKNELCAQ